MSDDPKAATTLRRLLDGTREQELDCARFLELRAPYLDGRIGDAELREQIAYHARQCPECDEELKKSHFAGTVAASPAPARACTASSSRRAQREDRAPHPRGVGPQTGDFLRQRLRSRGFR